MTGRNTVGNAVIIERQHYSAFGSPLNDNEQIRVTDSETTPKGYTGHEVLASMGLVHMNARLYDPALGRFISADTIVQAMDNTQGLNRYSYVMNNPLAYTDPSGHFGFRNISMNRLRGWFGRHRTEIITIALVAATYGALDPNTAYWLAGAITGAVGGIASTAMNGGSAKQVLMAGAKGALIGGFSGHMLGNMNSFVDNPMNNISGASAVTIKTMTAATVGLISNPKDPSSFKDAFISSLTTQVLGPTIGRHAGSSETGQYAAAAFVGGTASELSGGSFTNGAMSGAFSYMFVNNSAYNENVGNINMESSNEALILASKGGKQNISVGEYNRHSTSSEVEKAMNDAKKAGNISHFKKLRGLLKVIKRGGRMFGPALLIPPEYLEQNIIPKTDFDLDTQNGWDACMMAKTCV